MYNSPYETLACRAYNLNPIIKSLNTSLIEGNLTCAKLGDKTFHEVYLLTPLDKETPLFAHPITMERNGIEINVIDARGLIRVGKDDSSDFRVVQKADYNFQVARTILMEVAKNNSPDDIKNIGDIAVVSFARYIADNIVRRLGLSPEDQAVITAITAFYYLCLFREEGPVDEREFNKMVEKVSRVTHLSATWIFERFPDPFVLTNISEYSQALADLVDSSRTNEINSAVLISFLGGGWFGANGRENMAVALEHPPTFLAMVYIALTDKSYRNAGVSRTVLLNDKNNLGKQFIVNFERLIKLSGD